MLQCVTATTTPAAASSRASRQESCQISVPKYTRNGISLPHSLWRSCWACRYAPICCICQETSSGASNQLLGCLLALLPAASHAASCRHGVHVCRACLRFCSHSVLCAAPTASPQPEDENFSLAHDFCLQKEYYHSFGDVNPSAVEAYYAEWVLRAEAAARAFLSLPASNTAKAVTLASLLPTAG